MLVYMITNNVNGHRYIGITVCSLKKRWREHLCAARTGSEKRLYVAMRKYGMENFSIEKIYDATSFEDLQDAERRFIAQYETHASLNKGYNLTSGGEGRDRVDQLFGEKIYNSVLTEEVIEFIRSSDKKEMSNKALLHLVEEKFSIQCSNDAVRDARRGDTWTHLNQKYPPISVGQGKNRVWTEEGKAKAIELLQAAHKEAVAKSAEARKGKRGANAKLSEETVKDIFFSPASLAKTAQKFGVSKKMVLLIKQRRAHTYLTKGL